METFNDPFDDGADYDDDGFPRPWAPQPGEDDVSFSYFVAYKSLPPKDRSAAAVARMFDVPVTAIRELARRFSWPDRALSYDAWLDRRASEELARGRAKMREDDVAIAKIAKDKILVGLRSLNPELMSARDLATWFDLAVKVERQARGEPDKVTQTNVEVNIVDQLDAAARRALMSEAMQVLASRIGPAELEGVIEGEVVDDE